MSADEKSEDKKEIEDEEREKMLNAENKRDSAELGPQAERDTPKGEVEKMKKALEESEKEKEKEGKKKIPIGGIRIPGFLRSRSREKNNKDGESEHEEDKDLLHEAPPGTPPPADRDSVGTGQDQTPPSKRLSLKISNPFKKGKDPSPEQADGGDAAPKGKRLLDAIQLPLVSIFPRKPKGSKEAELGPAGLASMETLDDKSGADQGEDGMESVKLDVEEKGEGEKGEEAANKQDWRDRLRFISKFRLIVGGVSIFFFLLIIIIVVAVSGPRPSDNSTSLVAGRYITTITTCGPVEGVVEDGAYVFRGLPYALPPVGERRWHPARPVEDLKECWEGTLPAYNITPTCWQLYPNGSMDGAEDCLTLDVFTPRVSYHSPLSVVVLIGAETLLGGSPGDLLPSAKLARDHEVVFVRPNFRLGILGFLAADPLTQSIYPPTSGNYGLSDILAALKWVQLNIEHFGGDKNSVTVLGHRAGATLVTALTTSRLAHGLFERAWLSSGSGSFPGKSLQESVRNNAKYLKNLEPCKDNITAECLRSVDVEELINSIPENWKTPIPDLPMPDEESPHEWLVLDGVILRRHPFEVFDNNTMPFKIIIGTTAHSEASVELRKRHGDWTALDGDAVESHVRASALGTNRSLAGEAIRRYGTTWPGLASMVSDIRTVCPLLTMSRRIQLANGAFYVVTQRRGPQRIADVSSDVSVIMGRFKPTSPEERRFSSAMEKLFYRFAYFGEIRREEAGNTMLLIGQDTNPSTKYPNCDLWLMYDIVPRYARVD